MFDPGEKLIESLINARELINRAITARDRSERELYERGIELYMKIALELEQLQ